MTGIPSVSSGTGTGLQGAGTRSSGGSSSGRHTGDTEEREDIVP